MFSPSKMIFRSFLFLIHKYCKSPIRDLELQNNIFIEIPLLISYCQNYKAHETSRVTQACACQLCLAPASSQPVMDHTDLCLWAAAHPCTKCCHHGSACSSSTHLLLHRLLCCCQHEPSLAAYSQLQSLSPFPLFPSQLWKSSWLGPCSCAFMAAVEILFN